MWHWWRLASFGTALVLFLSLASSDVVGQKKANKKDAKDNFNPATDTDYAAIQSTKELVGTVSSMDSTTLTIRVETKKNEPNPKYKPPVPGKGTGTATNSYEMQVWRLQQDIARQQQQLTLARTPQQRQQAMSKLQQDMNRLQQQQAMYLAKTGNASAKANANPNNQPFITVSTFKDYTLDLQDKVVVRKLFLPSEFDDTGNLKSYSEKEKEELRGKDRTKPGYTAKIDEATTGQEVKLSLTAPKNKKKDAKKEVKKDKDSKTEDETPEEVERPTINMVVLTKEMASSGVQSAPDKNKKKKN